MAPFGLILPEAAAPEPEHLPAEARLWLAVICQAIVDGSGCGAMAHEQVAREEARCWLTEPSASLHAVPDAVGVELVAPPCGPGPAGGLAAGQGYARRRRPRTRIPAAT